MDFCLLLEVWIGKNISKNLGSKYSQKLLDHAEQSATDTLKTASKRAVQKTSRSGWCFNWKQKRR